jgi:UDP-hydrolysing UDP-N-acetyl-D-glucosamine 2-epimerase
MSKRRICVVVASRANYGRIKSALTAIRNHPGLELQLVVGASALLTRYGPAINVIRADGFEPVACPYFVVEGENPTTMAKSTGLGIVELSSIFENLKPDIVLTIADRHETLSTAVAATYMNIPLAHTQGGEVTGSIDESVRHAITKLAHIHFPATVEAKERLLRLGEDPETVFWTGCPALDIVVQTETRMDVDLFRKYGGVGPEFDLSRGFLLVVQHPVTTEYGCGREQVRETLEAVRELNRPTVWLWPNVDAGSDEVSAEIRRFREQYPRSPYLHFFKNFSPEDYVKVLASCRCIVGNSSSGIREGALLGTPCVNVGSRQQGRERGVNVVDADYDRRSILTAVQRQCEHGRYEPDYRFGDGHAGKRIADCLAAVQPRLQKRITY